MILEVLHHSEGAEALDADDLEECFVADGELLVLGVLHLVLLDDGPQLLDDLVAGHHVSADDLGELGAQLERAGEGGALLAARCTATGLL